MRRNDTSGWRVSRSSGGKSGGMKGVFGIEGGTAPDEYSATSFVYSCESFFVPVSTRRACEFQSNH